jgi:hypothetical protein
MTHTVITQIMKSYQNLPNIALEDQGVVDAWKVPLQSVHAHPSPIFAVRAAPHNAFMTIPPAHESSCASLQPVSLTPRQQISMPISTSLTNQTSLRRPSPSLRRRHRILSMRAAPPNAAREPNTTRCINVRIPSFSDLKQFLRVLLFDREVCSVKF